MPAHEHRTPLLAYAAVIAVFHTALGLATRRRVRKEGEGGLAAKDILLYGVATHKITNLIAEDRVTKAVRAPFVEIEDDGEHPSGSGLRRSLGELVTCPFCLGPWTALALAAGHSMAPRTTRFASGVFASVAISDFLHHGHALLKARVEEKRQLAAKAE